jgi:phosphoglycolate phosphatase-like HAD superfamily hydrolase
MNEIRTLVFDLDGTLAETAGDLIGALNFVLAAEGIDAVPVAAARTRCSRNS